MKKAKYFITEDNFREYARSQGWFDTICYESIEFCIDKDKVPSNILSVARKVFKNNYVKKERYNNVYIFTICYGDKETQKSLNTPLDCFADYSKKKNQEKFTRECINELKRMVNT